MDNLKQDIVQEDKVFVMQLLMEECCEMPKESEMESVLKKHMSNEIEFFPYGEKGAFLTLKNYKLQLKEGLMPLTLKFFAGLEFDNTQIDMQTRSQMRNCPKSDDILEKCKYQVLVTDAMGMGLFYKDRANILMDYMEALVELFPTCKAVYFKNSGKMFLAEAIRNHNIPRNDRFIYFAVNVRLFTVEGTKDMIMDSLGMKTLFMPDLQYHFQNMDPNHVANHAYNVLSYIFENENPIKDGDTIDGIENGKMSEKVHWKCQYEESLIQPVREVIDINMGKFASGDR